jgi:predicted metal-binding protein
MAHDGTRRPQTTTLCVLLCRDCCCGTERKHPDVDHTAQEHAFRAAAAESGGRVIRTRCLGVCERSNVVVVKNARNTYWFGGVLAAEQTSAITRFIRSGGTTCAPIELSFNVVPRPESTPYPCACAPVKLPV